MMMDSNGEVNPHWVSFAKSAVMKTAGGRVFVNANVGGSYVDDAYISQFGMEFDDVLSKLDEIHNEFPMEPNNYAAFAKNLVDFARAGGEKGAKALDILRRSGTKMTNEHMYDGFPRDVDNNMKPIIGGNVEHENILWAAAMQYATRGGEKNSGYVKATVWLKIGVSSKYDIGSNDPNAVPLAGNGANLSFTISKARFSGWVPPGFQCPSDYFDHKQISSVNNIGGGRSRASNNIDKFITGN